MSLSDSSLNSWSSKFLTPGKCGIISGVSSIIMEGCSSFHLLTFLLYSVYQHVDYVLYTISCTCMYSCTHMYIVHVVSQSLTGPYLTKMFMNISPYAVWIPWAKLTNLIYLYYRLIYPYNIFLHSLHVNLNVNGIIKSDVQNYKKKGKYRCKFEFD